MNRNTIIKLVVGVVAGVTLFKLIATAPVTVGIITGCAVVYLFIDKFFLVTPKV